MFQIDPQDSFRVPRICPNLKQHSRLNETVKTSNRDHFDEKCGLYDYTPSSIIAKIRR